MDTIPPLLPCLEGLEGPLLSEDEDDPSAAEADELLDFFGISDCTIL
jgi:hypothetical protein